MILLLKLSKGVNHFMNYETVEQALEQLQKLNRTYTAYVHALGVIELDAATAAPSGSWEGRGDTTAILSEVMYSLISDPKNGELIAYLKDHADALDAVQQRELEVLDKNYRQMNRIPAEEYVAFSVLCNDAQANWEKAKKTCDFSVFQPYLEKIVEFQRKFAGYYNSDVPAYDALLNEYEEGMTMEVLDVFFAQLRAAIVPLVEKIGKKEASEFGFMELSYPAAIQRQFSDFLMETMGLDRKHCGISESEHPFTMGFNNKDVRITTHYYEESFLSSMFSVIHEGGHALYELGGDDKYNHTMLYGGASMGIHESQSRFYENLIGRSRAFAAYVLPKLKELFPEQMSDVDTDMFYRAVNGVKPSLIRIEADELTYSLHIMVRYELEKQLISGTLAVKDVPAAWNRLYMEYLGVEVPNDTMGCLQDIHWSFGNLGYFPSYALGSAYGAQMLAVMQQELGDVFTDVENGDLSRITGWLRENIHQHSAFKKPGQLFEDACGKFDAKYYTEYLTQKYTELYNL